MPDAISKALRERIAAEAGYRCGYCLTDGEGRQQDPAPVAAGDAGQGRRPAANLLQRQG
jgi:hypothetical protein